MPARPRRFAVDNGSVSGAVTLPTGPRRNATAVVAHGAGTAMDHPFLVAFTDGLADRGVAAVRFNFPYTERGDRGPDRAPVLEDCYRAVLRAVRDDPALSGRLIIGGKSMGGRVASMVADGLHAEGKVAGLLCLGYPFHPPGQPEKTRTAHLAGLRTPTLIVQGTRDSLGSREDVAGYELSPQIRIVWLEDGDHSFKPRKSSGMTEKQHLEAAEAAVVGFVRGLA